MKSLRRTGRFTALFTLAMSCPFPRRSTARRDREGDTPPSASTQPSAPYPLTPDHTPGWRCTFDLAITASFPVLSRIASRRLVHEWTSRGSGKCCRKHGRPLPDLRTISSSIMPHPAWLQPGHPAAQGHHPNRSILPQCSDPFPELASPAAAQ